MQFKSKNAINLIFSSDFSGITTISNVDKTVSENLSGALLGTFVHNLNSDYVIIQAQDGNNN